MRSLRRLALRALQTMPRYVAFLRGVSPLNARMPELKRCFEAAGFAGVRTVLGSGNVVFDARTSTPQALERKAERAMQSALERAFPAIVRSVSTLQALLDADPYAAFDIPSDAKRVVTFLRRAPPSGIGLPIERDGVRILTATDREVFTVYVPGPKGPVFMSLLERNFGSDLTTRTWETVRKCARA
jgi:uncharacterized protein (DUF1697 family)